jgi:hypothetical protein
MPVFKTGAINHSATSPRRSRLFSDCTAKSVFRENGSRRTSQASIRGHCLRDLLGLRHHQHFDTGCSVFLMEDLLRGVLEVVGLCEGNVGEDLRIAVG